MILRIGHPLFISKTWVKVAQMSDDFDEIVAGNGDDADPQEEFSELIEVVAHYWKKFHPGEHFIKGILIVESAVATENKHGNGMVMALHHETSAPISSWAILGMLKSVEQTIAASSVMEYLTIPDEEGDEEDVEDE
jgi:hypothetical protein